MITALGYFSFQKSSAFLLARVITVRASSRTLNVFKPSRTGCVRTNFLFLRGIVLYFLRILHRIHYRAPDVLLTWRFRLICPMNGDQRGLVCLERSGPALLNIR